MQFSLFSHNFLANKVRTAHTFFSSTLPDNWRALAWATCRSFYLLWNPLVNLLICVISASKISTKYYWYLKVNIEGHIIFIMDPLVVVLTPTISVFQLFDLHYVFQSIYQTQLWSVSICETSSQTFFQEWAGTLETVGKLFTESSLGRSSL